jgi:hypothetical protein
MYWNAVAPVSTTSSQKRRALNLRASASVAPLRSTAFTAITPPTVW